jgi:hypothetical protein
MESPMHGCYYACGGMSSLTICFNLPGNKLKTGEGPNHTVAIPGPKIYILTIACYNDEIR